MSKQSRFRGPFDKRHCKRAETLLQSEQQQLYHIYWSLSSQFSRKNGFLVVWKILGLFVNPLTADGKYCLVNRGNLLQHFDMQLSQKGKIFSEFFFFFEFSKFRFNFEHFQKRMTLIADLFLNLRTPKNVVR